MILHNRDGGTKRLFPSLRKIGLPLFLFLLVGILVMYYQGQPTPFPKQGKIVIDAEHTKDGHFTDGKHLFGGGDKQSNEFAHSGKYACKLQAAQGKDQYGFSYKLTDFVAGDHYRASVWMFAPGGTKGFLVVSAEGETPVYEGTDEVREKDDNGWGRLQVDFIVPFHTDLKTIDFYVYSNGHDPMYFDDMVVEKVAHYPAGIDSIPTIALTLKPEAFQKIEDKRREALSQGILMSDDEDWVKGKLAIPGRSDDLSVQLRLKGDWLDHLLSDKWSFRVKINDTQSWNGMMTFSLHQPSARYYLHEWLLHKIFEQEDVLTTRYDFVQLTLNGEPMGLYAYEEHFEKQLVESRKRREGPIIRFSETGLWASFGRQLSTRNSISYEWSQPMMDYQNASIEPFGPSKILASEGLSPQFAQAQDLLEQLRKGFISPEAAFDIPRMAKYYAICDAMGAYHGVTWHNQRFYFNPVTNKLEPIGFDGFDYEPSKRYEYLGEGKSAVSELHPGGIFSLLYVNEAFMEAYITALQRVSSAAYLQNTIDGLRKEVEVRQYFMQKEYDYQFNAAQVMNDAQFVHGKIEPIAHESVRAAKRSINGDQQLLDIQNLHTLPLVVVGYGVKEDPSLMSSLSKVALPAASPRVLFDQMAEGGIFSDWSKLRSTIEHSQSRTHPLATTEVMVPASAKYIFASLPGQTKVFAFAIRPFAMPSDLPVFVADPTFSELKAAPYWEIKNKKVRFRPGQFQFQSPITIPRGYEVVIPAGTTLDFVKGAYFISYSPVQIQGSEEQPAMIHSSDRSMQGFTMIQPDLPCKWRYAIFDNLTTLSLPRWHLTGAVTVYEGEMTLEKCVFRNNHCEDGLNMIRTKFTMHQCLVSHTPFDGFDCDFCEGEVERSTFQYTENDGFDVSGSIIYVQDCLFQYNKDKGMSVGEASDVGGQGIRILNSHIGMASKDKSTLLVKDVVLENIDQGFVAYQKKPEYGGATMAVQKYTAKNVKRLYQAASGSRIALPIGVSE